MITINYNSVDLFDGISATPFISRSDDVIYKYGHQGLAEKIVLTGRIRVDPCEAQGQFKSLYDLQRLLISRLSKNFQPLEILENSSTLYYAESAVVESISFDDSNYLNLLPFTIEFTVYSDGFAAQGILDPVDEFAFSNTESCRGELTHTISARGINTSEDALRNVENFVLSRQGWSNQVTPLFVNMNTAFLKSRDEKINRLTGVYSITEKYIFSTDDAPITTGILEYSTDVNENDVGEVVVSISGTITGGINTDISILRADLVSVNWFNLAQAEYALLDPSGTLSTSPITYSVTEDANVISFRFEFSNKAYSGPYIIDTTTITFDGELNESCIRYKAKIQSDYGCPSKRWSEVSAYYDSISIEGLARAAWAKFGNGARLGLFPRSRSYSQSEQLGTITAEISFCNAKGETCGCLEDFEYSLSFAPAIPTYVANVTLNGEGCYHVQNYGYNRRAIFAVNGRAIISNCCSIAKGIAELKTRLNQLNAKYFAATDKILLEFKTTENDNARNINFSCSWNGRANSTIPNSLFTP